jgi:hypothetical protein
MQEREAHDDIKVTQKIIDSSVSLAIQHSISVNRTPGAPANTGGCRIARGLTFDDNNEGPRNDEAMIAHSLSLAKTVHLLRIQELQLQAQIVRDICSRNYSGNAL